MSSIHVFTFNILTDNGTRTGITSFAERSKLFEKHFLSYGPDLIGFQETMPYEREWLKDNLKDFDVYGMGRNADLTGESNVIACRKDRFELVTLDMFWLSDTPRVPGSRFHSDQSSCPRICMDALLADKQSGRCLRFYNTHLDHKGELAQAQGISLILARIAADYAENPLPVILTGDMNVTPESAVYKSVTEFTGCGRPLRDVSANTGLTYHGFRHDGFGAKIDYIFTTLPCDETKTAAIKDEENGCMLSDHYPVGAVLELGE
ncbi:MAG: endonuclease/exonuclease/phosphatase family protein [Clostridia bacterium]|nr:endonuclease/exonuclease/phosphatase family protein [Clostridia bacterium]